MQGLLSTFAPYKVIFLFFGAFWLSQLTGVTSDRGKTKLQPEPWIVAVPTYQSQHPSTNLTVFRLNNHHNGYLIRSTESSLFIEAPCVDENGNRQTEDCKHPLQRVSKQGQSCCVAVNAGPFGAGGSLIGGVVMRGRLVHDFSTKGDVGFGLLQDTEEWIVGYVNASMASSLQEFVTGFGWLVYQGMPVDDHGNPTGAKRAPRTAIGLDKDGRLLMLVVDGCEKCFRNQGPTLRELAELFVSRGAYHAINFDGGSSSTLVMSGSVRNKPTCLDLPITCERPVGTTFCLRDRHGDVQ